MNLNKYNSTQSPFIKEFDTYTDLRGILHTFDASELPFQVQRIFTISPDSPKTTRGGHAHKICWQAIFTIGENIEVCGKNRSENFIFNLEPGLLLIVPPWNWIQIHFEREISTAVILCSHRYDPDDYMIDAP